MGLNACEPRGGRDDRRCRLHGGVFDDALQERRWQVVGRLGIKLELSLGGQG